MSFPEMNKLFAAAVFTCMGVGAVTASPLTVATWNVAWLADEPLATMEEVKFCEKQDKDRVDFGLREPAHCRKGKPFRMAGAYSLLAQHVKRFDFDIIGLQEVQSADAAMLILGDRPLPSGNSSNMPPAGTYKLAVNPDGGWQKVGLAVKASLLQPGKDLQATPLKELGMPMKRDQRSALDVTVPLKSGPLRILVVHLKSACHRVPLNSGTDDCNQLAAQAPVLQNWIQQRQSERKPFLVLGDFNRVLASSAAHEMCSPGMPCTSMSLRASLDGNSVGEQPILIPTADAQHVPECGYKGDLNLIDHIVLGGGVENAYAAQSVRSHPFVDKSGAPVPKGKVQYLSDHCPVSVQLNF